MARSPLQITITGDEKMEQMLGVYARRMRRPFRGTDAASRVIQYANDEAMRQIKEGQHGDYKPLSPAYRAWKSARYPSRPTLVITERTVKSMTTKSSRDFYHRVRGRGRSLEFGSKYWLAAVHQTGNRSRNLPARPLFRVTRRVAERVAEIVSDALVKGL